MLSAVYLPTTGTFERFQDPCTFATFLDEQKTIQLIHRVLKGKTHAANSFAAHAAESKLALDKNIATASNI